MKPSLLLQRLLRGVYPELGEGLAMTSPDLRRSELRVRRYVS